MDRLGYVRMKIFCMSDENCQSQRPGLRSPEKTSTASVTGEA